MYNEKYPARFNDKIWQSLNKTNEFFKQFINNAKLKRDYDWLRCIRGDLAESIRSSKEKLQIHLSAKSSNPSTSAKTCWSIHKTFVNGKKVPLIPPLLVNRKFVPNFLEKANIFNDFFSQECEPISNDGILPSILNITQ